MSKSSINLLPKKGAVRSDLKPFKRETEPLVKMEDDAYQLDGLKIRLKFMETY